MNAKKEFLTESDAAEFAAKINGTVCHVPAFEGVAERHYQYAVHGASEDVIKAIIEKRQSLQGGGAPAAFLAACDYAAVIAAAPCGWHPESSCIQCKMNDIEEGSRFDYLHKGDWQLIPEKVRESGLKLFVAAANATKVTRDACDPSIPPRPECWEVSFYKDSGRDCGSGYGMNTDE
jgi:hypothetical protein